MMQKMTIEDIPVKGKLVLIRVDFNVPLDENGTIVEDTRIRAALPTINHCIDEGAKIILASHLGRPKGVVDHALSLAPVRKRLERLLSKEVLFVDDCVGPKVDAAIAAMEPGQVLLLENVRFHKEET